MIHKSGKAISTLQAQLAEKETLIHQYKALNQELEGRKAYKKVAISSNERFIKAIDIHHAQDQAARQEAEHIARHGPEELNNSSEALNRIGYKACLNSFQL